MTISTAYQQLLYQLYDLYDNREAANIADWVIERVTGFTKIDRVINKQFPLNPQQQQQLQLYTNQLLQHRPVQYVLQKAWFAGMKFYVDENVLIPRPETDELVEEVVVGWQLKDDSLNHSSFSTNNLLILDIGSGSGCIPIALKKKLPKAVITSVDVSEKALQVAQKNADTLGFEVNFKLLDFLEENNWQQLSMFDIIVSNPPYIKQSESDAMHRNVIAYEPPLALFVADDNALIFYKKIALFGTTHLNPKGKIYVEINEALGRETVTLFESFGYKAQLKKDMQGRDRMVICNGNTDDDWNTDNSD